MPRIRGIIQKIGRALDCRLDEESAALCAGGTAEAPVAMRASQTRTSNLRLPHVDRIPGLRRNVVHCRRPFQFVPGEFAAFERALQRFEKDNREQLPVSEAL